MSIELTRRIASQMMKRGESKVRIKKEGIDDAKKALSRDDVRAMISKGTIYAIEKKHNVSAYSRVLNAKRTKGRRRGAGRRKGAFKARVGTTYMKRIRGQRRVLLELKADLTIKNEDFKKYYRLVRGGNFPAKLTLLNRLVADGVKIDQKRFEELRHI